MGYTKEQRIINSVIGSTKQQRNEKKEISPTGSFNIPNKSGDHYRSYKRDTPVNDYDIVNKKYVDDEINANTPWTIDSSTQISYDYNINLEDTTSATTGVILKDGDTFLHNFHHPTGDTATPDGNNTFIGVNAGNFTMGSTATEKYHGSDNVAIGQNAGSSLTTGYRNLFLGYRAGMAATEAASCVGIGYNALNAATTAVNSLALGRGAGQNITTGGGNIALGAYSFSNSQTDSGNTIIGGSAGYYIKGSNNTMIGNNAGYGTSGISGVHSNVFVGGVIARYLTSDCLGNTIVGYSAAFDMTSGTNNIILGRLASQNLTTGSTNIILGYNSASTLTTGSGNFIVGWNTDVSAANASNELNIFDVITGDLSAGDVDVSGDFTAGTIQADNGYTGSFTNGDGNTVTVVGGIITGVA